ncbi:aminoacyl tRNA synthase complex-interacting multifunctional protein 1-like isoform X2 [Macrosteles quadrilineatus]|nr:aminoacyl tRNA synthase complex-interacting multifunctional protein 1-like isoform X2 [Macrosteles quadrilineatus]
MDLRVGKVRDLMYNPRAHKYYITAVNFGDIFSDVVGCMLVNHYEPEELIDRLVICCCNIKTQWTRESDFYTNMLVASSSDVDAKLELLNPPDGAEPGDIITVQDYPRDPDRPYMDPKAKMVEEISELVKINDRGLVLYKSKPWYLEKDPSLGHVYVTKTGNSFLRVV